MLSVNNDLKSITIIILKCVMIVIDYLAKFYFYVLMWL